MNALRRFWGWLSLDARDGFFFAGLMLLAVGLWLMWPPMALSVSGLVLVVFALTAGR